MVALGLLLFAGCLAALLAVGRHDRAKRAAAAATVSLVADDWGVRRTLADGRHEEVSWAELLEVRLITLPRGPWDDRRRIVLDGGGERGCIVPMDVAQQHDLLTQLVRLPGFDYRLLADADERTRTGNQVLWQRVPASS